MDRYWVGWRSFYNLEHHGSQAFVEPETFQRQASHKPLQHALRKHVRLGQVLADAPLRQALLGRRETRLGRGKDFWIALRSWGAWLGWGVRLLPCLQRTSTVWKTRANSPGDSSAIKPWASKKATPSLACTLNFSAAVRYSCRSRRLNKRF